MTRLPAHSSAASLLRLGGTCPGSRVPHCQPGVYTHPPFPSAIPPQRLEAR